MELGVFAQFFQDLYTNGLTGLGEMIQSALPLSPFQPYISYFENLPYIGWINWFLPVKGYFIIWGTWISAIGTYYIWMGILRWIKAIE